MYHNIIQHIVYYFLDDSITAYDILLTRCNSFTLLHLVHLVLFLLLTLLFTTMLDRCTYITRGVKCIASLWPDSFSIHGREALKHWSLAALLLPTLAHAACQDRFQNTFLSYTENAVLLSVSWGNL